MKRERERERERAERERDRIFFYATNVVKANAGFDPKKEKVTRFIHIKQADKIYKKLFCSSLMYYEITIEGNDDQLLYIQFSSLLSSSLALCTCTLLRISLTRSSLLLSRTL